MLITLVLVFIKIFPPRRRKFKQWSELETLSKEILDIVNGEKLNEFPNLIYEYIHIATNFPIKLIEKFPWEFTITLYYVCMSLNVPKKIPLLALSEDKKEDKEISWDYRGRTWIYWEHLFAKQYGWSREYISNLDVDVALGHIQEIYTTQQLEREFLWGMSEIAYPYNSRTKQSKFSPLPRPYWMGERVKPIKLVKIPKIFMPQGLIKDDSGMGAYVQKEIENKKIESQRND